MDKSTHTPGPWTTHDRSIWAGEILLAKVYKQGDDGEPNARLIAAAPTMRNELEWVSRCAQFKGPVGTTLYAISDEHMDAIRAILRDVEGESNG